MESVLSYLYAAPGLLAAMVLHELAHAYVATYLGDPTPKYQGRLTLNPLAHVDWIGLIMLVVIKFGWAKPVQVNPYNFRNPRQGMMWVALAGPVTNVLIAYVCLSLLRQVPDGAAYQVLYYAVIYNVYFAVFNILPIPPLDGSRVLAAISDEGSRLVYSMERWGWVLLMLVVFTRPFQHLLLWLASGLLAALRAASGAF